MNPYTVIAFTGVTNTTLTNVTDQISTVIDQMITIMTTLVSNPFFAFLFAIGFVRILMSLIRRAKRTAR